MSSPHALSPLHTFRTLGLSLRRRRAPRTATPPTRTVLATRAARPPALTMSPRPLPRRRGGAEHGTCQASARHRYPALAISQKGSRAATSVAKCSYRDEATVRRGRTPPRHWLHPSAQEAPRRRSRPASHRGRPLQQSADQNRRPAQVCADQGTMEGGSTHPPCHSSLHVSASHMSTPRGGRGSASYATHLYMSTPRWGRGSASYATHLYMSTLRGERGSASYATHLYMSTPRGGRGSASYATHISANLGGPRQISAILSCLQSARKCPAPFLVHSPTLARALVCQQERPWP